MLLLAASGDQLVRLNEAFEKVLFPMTFQSFRAVFRELSKVIGPSDVSTLLIGDEGLPITQPWSVLNCRTSGYRWVILENGFATFPNYSQSFLTLKCCVNTVWRRQLVKSKLSLGRITLYSSLNTGLKRNTSRYSLRKSYGFFIAVLFLRCIF